MLFQKKKVLYKEEMIALAPVKGTNDVSSFR